MMFQMVITGLFVGILLGFVLQRGRFCLTGGFRDMLVAKINRLFYALLIAILIQSIGVYTLFHFGVIAYTAGPFSWFASMLGGFIFGIGMIYAGGCATGTWYRAGEGLIGSWIALFGYMLMSAMMREGPLGSLNARLQAPQFAKNSIAETVGISVWILIGCLFVIVASVLYKEWKKPKLLIPTMIKKRTGLAHLLFEKRWHPFVTASLVGLIAILAWPLSAATGRVFGLGITTPSANILQYLVIGDTRYLNWGVFLVLGIFIGSFIAAKCSHEFRVRVPDAKTCIHSLVGGFIMGFGASLAGGCTIGNGLVMTALMTWQGWVTLLFIILGTWVASYFVFIRPNQ